MLWCAFGNLAPRAIVGLFPSDHYIGNEARFASYADYAFDIAANSTAVVLLGAEAKNPEQAYGWIEPETSLTSADQRLFSVRRFVEKPDARLANELWRGGALWNTLVVVARLSTLLQMFIPAMPRLYKSFSDIRTMLGTVLEGQSSDAPVLRNSDIRVQRAYLAAMCREPDGDPDA